MSYPLDSELKTTVAPAVRRLAFLGILSAATAIALAVFRPERDKAFATYLQAREANDTITLEQFVISEASGVTAADPFLDVILTNRSRERVQLPYNLALRVFAYQPLGQTWIELRDESTYLQENPPPVVLEAVTDPPFNQKVSGVWPTGDGLATATHLRVMVAGNILGENGELGEEVMAYVEIELQH